MPTACVFPSTTSAALSANQTRMSSVLTVGGTQIGEGDVLVPIAGGWVQFSTGQKRVILQLGELDCLLNFPFFIIGNIDCLRDM